MIKPVNSYILIKLKEENEITKSGLIIGTNENNVKKGMVIETSDNSKIKKEDIVLFNVNDSETVNHKHELYYLILDLKVLAIVEGEENE